MSVGEGIFYGLVFLGIIYLYIQTKDRWNWRKIVLWGIGSIIGVIVLIICISLLEDSFKKISFNKFQSQSKPQVISSMNGITLGEKLTDVIFRTGSTKDKRQADVYNFTSDENKFFSIDNESKTVKTIGYWCTQDELNYPNLYNNSKLNGVGCGDSEFGIFLNYGKENIRVLCRKKKASINEPEPEMIRRYDAADFGVSYLLVTNKVKGIYLHYPDDLKKFTSDNWSECSN